MFNTLQEQKMVTAEQIKAGKALAHSAAAQFFQERLGGQDQFACGFAWVTVHGVRSNSKQGKELAKEGFSKSYSGGLQLWNPSGMYVQNVDTLEAGAEAMALYLRSLGLEAYSGSRLD
jgi:hypothetical protein